MKKQLINLLNEVYQPLHRRTDAIKRALNSAGYEVVSGWYPLHSVNYDGGFLTEYFPIPVLFVKGICDIGVDLDEVFIEGKLLKADAANLDVSRLKDWRYQLYGAENYEVDLYSPQDIMASDEEEICLCVYCQPDEAMDNLLSIIAFFATLK